MCGFGGSRGRRNLDRTPPPRGPGSQPEWSRPAPTMPLPAGRYCLRDGRAARRCVRAAQEGRGAASVASRPTDS